MKKISIYLLQAVLVCALASCEKGLENEDAFIHPGENPEVPKNPLWDWSETYPGPVNSQLEVLPDTVITIKGQYKPIPYSPKTPILQSTGLYAGIDNNISIDVPANAVGLKYQIGLAHPLASGQAQRRYGDVVKRGSLEPGRINEVSSNFGGYLYFYYEPQDVESALPELTVHVSNAYQSFDYFKGSDADAQRYYVRIMKERNEKLRDTSISDGELVFLNWTELRSPKIILTFGLKEMYYLTSPERLLEQYEKLVDSFLEFGGYDKAEDYELPLFRVYADVQLPNSKQKKVAKEDGSNEETQDERKGPGYPIGVLKAMSMRGNVVIDESKYMSEKDQLSFGFNNNDNTKFAATQYGFGITVLGEWAKAGRMKFPLLRIANHYHCQNISGFGDFWGSPGYTQHAANWRAFLDGNWMRTPYNTMSNAARNKYMWFFGSFDLEAGQNPRENQINDVKGQPNSANDEVNARFEGRRAMVFMQLIQRYGWGIIGYINQRCLEVGFVNEYEQDAHDFFVMAACEYADADLRPFFRWWQFPYTAHVVKFIRQQGFPELTKDYMFTAKDAVSRPYYFFDWPGAAEAWFPNNKPQINSDAHQKGVNPPRKAATWPEKPYYKQVTKEAVWVAYGEIVQANPYYPDPVIGQNWIVEYEPNMWRTTSQTDANRLTRAGYVASTYLWFNCADNGANPKRDERLKARLLASDNYAHGGAGAFGGLKGGTGMGWNDRPDRGSDTTINWAIVDIDFQKPVRFNAIRTAQPYSGSAHPNDFGQAFIYYQYYVEPEYVIPADPTDPTSEDVTVRTGFVVDEGYKYDPQNDPRRAVWKGYEHPDNNVPYPGRTKNMDDNAVLPPNGNNMPQMKTGNWGFHKKGEDGESLGYFALVYPNRPVIKDHKKANSPSVAMDDQDWYTGITWLVRDDKARTYVYYLEETIETRRVRLFMRPAINHRLDNAMSYHDPKKNENDRDASWRVRMQEINFGLVSTDIPAPGTIPPPHEFYKGFESGDYPNVTARNYGGGNPNNGW